MSRYLPKGTNPFDTIPYLKLLCYYYTNIWSSVSPNTGGAIIYNASYLEDRWNSTLDGFNKRKKKVAWDNIVKLLIEEDVYFPVAVSYLCKSYKNPDPNQLLNRDLITKARAVQDSFIFNALLIKSCDESGWNNILKMFSQPANNTTLSPEHKTIELLKYASPSLKGQCSYLFCYLKGLKHNIELDKQLAVRQFFLNPEGYIRYWSDLPKEWYNYIDFASKEWNSLLAFDRCLMIP